MVEAACYDGYVKPKRDDLVPLTTAPNEPHAGLIRAVLEQEGIESWQHAGDGAALGIFGAALINPTSVMVRREDIDRAQAVLDRRREDSIDIDWAEVDVGEPEDELAARIVAGDGGGYPQGRLRGMHLVGITLVVVAISVFFAVWQVAVAGLTLIVIFLVRMWRIRRRHRRTTEMDEGRVWPSD